MTQWYDEIVNKFIPNTAEFTLVFDPDLLCSDAGVIHELKDKGFNLLFYENVLTFRYEFETQLRDRPKTQYYQNILLIVQGSTSSSVSLPYDVFSQSDREIWLNLGDIFPTLSYPILWELNQNRALTIEGRSLFEVLHGKVIKMPHKQLSEAETKEFILKYVFQFTLETVQDSSSLLSALLRLHYSGYQLPDLLSQYLLEKLIVQSSLSQFPLESIVKDRQAFFEFLQQHWPDYLRQEILQGSSLVSDQGNPDQGYATLATNPLPFGDKAVRAYIDSLFLEGLLKPVSPYCLGIGNPPIPKEAWFRVGLELDPRAEIQDRVERLAEKLLKEMPAIDTEHTKWLSFGFQWANLLVLWHQLTYPQQSVLQNHFHLLETTADTQFLEWTLRQYHTLHYQSPVSPVMVHHIPRFLARQLEAGSIEKVALILMDGLALDQWLAIRPILATQLPDLAFRERSVFAWLPTLTSVSRQALFAGKPPIGFPQSIFRTNKEPKLWEQFWVDQGFSPSQVAYQAGLRDPEHLNRLKETLTYPSLKILGLVVDKIDRISHHKESGTPAMHQQIRPWAEGGFLRSLLQLLLERGFAVFITADHGNIEAVGIGSPSEKAIADYRGQRARVYADQALRAQVKEQFRDAIEWDSPVLPSNFMPLLAPGRSAFIPKGEVIVTHGGISMEELIVPLICVTSTASL